MRLSDLAGRILFPQQDRWERRRNVKLLFVAVSLILVALLLGLVLVRKGMRHDELNPEPQLILKSTLPS